MGEWTPVQAHATEHRVALLYLCKNAGSAAYLKDWDGWRETGITVTPVYYSEDSDNGSPITDEDALDRLALAVYKSLIGGSPAQSSVLISGLPGTVATGLSRRLAMDGVSREWIWGV